MKGDKMKKNKMDPIGNLIRYGSFSAKWTTFFAVVALFSICALGLTKVSFALEEWPQTLTNSEIDNSKQLSGQSGVPNGGIANKYIQKNGQRIPIYCLEEWKHYGKGSTFNKKDSNSFLDDGAIALLTKAYTEYPSPSERQQAIIQLALWAYLYEHNSAWKAAADATQSLPEPDDHSGMSVEQMNQLKANTALWNDISPWIEFAVNNSQGFADPQMISQLADQIMNMLFQEKLQLAVHLLKH